jgi:hypothetical protein
MTKAIGWDIGIKNLAYCVLDSGASSNSPNAFLFNNKYYFIVKTIIINNMKLKIEA